MARKKKNQEELAVQQQVNFQQEPMFESDAYYVPQPNAGADVTVLKTVGAGGPAPIVTPTNSTVQLQAVVVPVAVVPYMSHDSSILMAQTPAYRPYGQQQPIAPANTGAEKIKKQRKCQPRIFGLVNFLLYTVALLPFILAFFMDEVGGISLAHYNLIEIVHNWIANGFSWTPLVNIGYFCIAAVLAVGAVISLLTIIFGKYAKVLNILLTLLAVGAHVAFLVKRIINNEFVPQASIAFLVCGIASVVNFIVSIAFTAATNKLADKAENAAFAREI